MSHFTLHIFMSSIEYATRLYKEAAYTRASGICTRVVVLGLWQEGLRTEEITEDGLEIRRLPTMIRRFRNTSFVRRFGLLRKALRLLSLFQYSSACVLAARRMRPDHVSCHNAFMLPVAWAAARLSGATLEYLPHELETQRSGLAGLEKRITAFFERRFIHSARNVVVVCDPIRDWYQTTYGLTNVHVVRNVPESDAVQIRPIPEGGFRERFDIPESARVFIYQGMFSAGRGIEALLKIFADLDPRCSHLVLMGYAQGDYQSLIDEALERYPNIHFQPAVSRKWIVSYSTGADIGIFIAEDVPLNDRYALPNKFFEWAHAGLPILVSDNLEYLAELARDGKLGWSCPFAEVAASVRQISQTDLSSYVENVRRFAAPAVWEEDAKVFAHVYRARSGPKDQ